MKRGRIQVAGWFLSTAAAKRSAEPVRRPVTRICLGTGWGRAFATAWQTAVAASLQ